MKCEFTQSSPVSAYWQLLTGYLDTWVIRMEELKSGLYGKEPTSRLRTSILRMHVNDLKLRTEPWQFSESKGNSGYLK